MAPDCKSDTPRVRGFEPRPGKISLFSKIKTAFRSKADQLVNPFAILALLSRGQAYIPDYLILIVESAINWYTFDDVIFITIKQLLACYSTALQPRFCKNGTVSHKPDEALHDHFMLYKGWQKKAKLGMKLCLGVK